MPDHSQQLRFEGLSRPVELRDGEAVLDYLPKALRGWRYSLLDGPAENPVLRLRREEGTYRLEASWIDGALRHTDPVDALCALIAEFIRAYVTQDDRLLCLHGAAAEFAGRLVVFPNRYRAGKSILSACLAASGIRLFADDVLPICDDDSGMAPGFAPRLRLPLPDDLSPAMSDAILSRAGVRGKRYLYLDLDPAELAAQGATAPVGAVVLLEREAGATPELSPVPRGEVLKRVIWQNFAREAPPKEILDRLHRVVAGARCLRLRYGRAEEAVPILRETFARWPDRAADQPGEPAPAATAVRGEAGGSIRSGEALEGCYLRKPDVEDVTIDGERFLADSSGSAIYHLNPVASAVWHLLCEPSTSEHLIDALHSAFPDAGRDRIARDVGALLRDLSERRLLLKVAPPGA